MDTNVDGWYTNELVDRAMWRFYADVPDSILSEYQDFAVGGIVADGPDYAASFRVLAVEPDEP